jgi:choline-sulfatase
VTGRAFADQAARVAALGGPEQVMRMGNYPYTPAPGEDPRYSDDLALG